MNLYKLGMCYVGVEVINRVYHAQFVERACYPSHCDEAHVCTHPSPRCNLNNSRKTVIEAILIERLCF
jgi:folate-binding Fe-S cluster repair protein YgfZ